MTDDPGRGYFIDYLLDRDDVKGPWHDYTHHDFVKRLGDGTLPRETFKFYMIQDYLYLASSRDSLIDWNGADICCSYNSLERMH